MKNPDAKAGQTGLFTMTRLLFVGLAAFIAWAAYFEIDESVHAAGQIIPVARTQIIQAADGGVLSQILVREGESVKAGQRLAVLEKSRSEAGYEEARAKLAALQVALIRAEAEASGRSPDFGSLGQEFPQFVQAQRLLFDQRKRSLTEELAPLGDSLVMARSELSMNETLLKNGDASQIETMRAKRQVNDIVARMSSVSNKYRQDARAEAAKLQEDISSANSKLNERKSILDHTDLLAPVAGVVKFLRFNTVGGVLRAGDEMMQISPSDGALIIELKLLPVDIGKLREGLPVVVKLDAFDYSIYGTLAGTLTYISSDTLSEQGANGQSTTYFRAHARVLPADKQSNPKLAGVEIKAGMTAGVDIQTGRRTVLQYLMKPIAKAFGGALTER